MRRDVIRGRWHLQVIADVCKLVGRNVVPQRPCDCAAQLRPILLPLAAGAVVFVVCTLVVLCCFEAVGNTYRSLPAVIRRQLRSATLYHYCDAAFLDQFVDRDSGTVTLHRRARTMEPYLTGRRALYLYTAHGPRGAKSNHPKRWRSAAAVITISGADLPRGRG